MWLTPVSTDNEINKIGSFIPDFETTAEELGLLNSSQTDSIFTEKSKLGNWAHEFCWKNNGFIQK